jgi:hypothetical protein
MDNLKKIAGGAIVTLLIGGTAYTLNQADIVKNFADESGLTQEQAEQYVNAIPEEDLASWDVIGEAFVIGGQEVQKATAEIDCVNYSYDWESPTLSCSTAKLQLDKWVKDSIALGYAYKKLDVEGASKIDIQNTITLIDQINANYQLEAVIQIFDPSLVEEERQTNLYNKAILKTALESETGN